MIIIIFIIPIIILIIQDGIIPIINPMGVLSSRNEPTRALLLTVAICQVPV